MGPTNGAVLQFAKRFVQTLETYNARDIRDIRRFMENEGIRRDIQRFQENALKTRFRNQHIPRDIRRFLTKNKHIMRDSQQILNIQNMTIPKELKQVQNKREETKKSTSRVGGFLFLFRGVAKADIDAITKCCIR